MWCMNISVLIYILFLSLLACFLQSGYLCCIAEIQTLLMLLHLELHLYQVVHSSEDNGRGIKTTYV